MWLNSKDEPEFAKVLDYEEGSGNQIRILNSGKRKRFLKHEDEITPGAIEKTLEKILGGDARFKNIRGNKLPELVSDYPAE